MKEQAWVVVANGSIARIFVGQNDQALTELETLEHPATRVHGRDLVSGKPGRAFDSIGGGRHSLEPQLTPQKNEAQHFAEHLAQHLEHARKTGAFGKLYVIASPAFLGQLRNSLHTSTKDVIALEVDRDATSKTPVEIRAYLPFRL